MRKKLTLLLAVVMTIALATFAVACSKNNADGKCNHSGGTATCTAKAICEKCGKEYGELDPENHSSTGFVYETKEGGKHDKKHACCNVIAVADEACSGGAATVCGERNVCQFCHGEYGEALAHDWATEWSHDDNGHWHACTRSGCTAKNDDAVHGGGTATCTAKAVCETCGASYGELNAENHSGTETRFVSNGDGTHNEVYVCCDAVKAENVACSGGAAMVCGAKNVCEFCHGEYGEALAHDWATEWSHDDNGHWHACTRSGCTAKKDEAAHAGGAATVCGAKNVCETCNAEYGEALPHDWATEWSHDDNMHWHACKRSDCAKKSDEGMHTGGTATCIEKAACEVCGQEYGNFAAHVYGEWKHNAEKHWKECTVEGCNDKSEEGAHNFVLWDKTDARYDYKACECGETDENQSFNKVSALINQRISLSQSTYSIKLDGVDEYASVEKISLDNYDFGADPAALVISDAFKADTKKHGRQTLTVVVKGADEATHELKIVVTFVTAEITDSGDFAALQPTSANKAVYGYYVLNNDISGVSTGVAYSDWDATTGFFGTFDGQGHTITAPANGNQGLFGILRNATIKNLTIKDNWRSGGDATLLARGCFGITMENVNIVYAGGSATTGCGWLSNAEFSNNKLINVTVDNGSASFSSVFGNKFRNNAFDNVVIKGTFTEIGYTGTKNKDGNVTAEGESVVSAADVTKLEIKKETLDGRQDFVLDGGVSVINLGKYNGCEIISATTSTGFDLASLNSAYAGDAFKAAKDKHGEQTVNVTLIYNGETVVVVVPVTVITKYITTMSELQDAVKHTNGADNIYGYYVLKNDVSYKDAGYTVKAASGGWSSDNAFRGTLDGRGFTITINSSTETYGIFGTINGATIKNVIIKDMWNNAGYKPIIARNAYNATFSDVTIEIAGGAKLSGENDNTPIIGNTMQKCTLNKVKIKSSVEIVNVFANQSGNQFTEVTIVANVTGGFSKTSAAYPDGVTVSAS